MPKAIKYTIFKTKWGYFGLAGTEFALLRTHLPGPEPEKIKRQLLKNLSFVNRDSSIEYRESSIEFDKALFGKLQQQITAYFEGTSVNFSRDIPIALDDRTSICHSRAGGNPQTTGNGKSAQILPMQRIAEFTKQVLTACRDIRFGQTISYSGLAKNLGRPAAASPVRNSTKGRKPQKGKISNGARAVGNALAKNPLPLIIPCHRVVRSNGKIGGFSAPGGTNLKAKLLELEQQVIRDRKSD